MTPDFDRAATAAMETLIKYNINTAPVLPFPIFKRTPGVLVLSFAEISDAFNIERKHFVNIFGEENQDAITTVHTDDNKLRYVVTYNQRLPFYMLQRSLARELGHIVLGHDGSRSVEARTAEAYCFAYHLLCPRPLIKAVQDAGIKLTTEVLGNMTGCYERCLLGMKQTPGTNVPAELNQKVREQFADYIDNFLDYQSIISASDNSPVADFGTYMDNYEEE